MLAACSLAVAFDVEAHAQAIASDAPSTCEQSYEQAQVRRQKRELLAAKAHLMRCAQADCPQVARTDCANWLMEVERSIPSVILLPRREGVDLLDVMAVVDGTPTMVKPGEPLALEPGPHRVVVQAGSQERTTTFTLPEGEKLRQLVFEFGPEPEPESSGGERSTPLLATAIATGAGSVVGFGLFATFGSLGLAQEDDLSSCKPSCGAEEVSAVEDLYLVADVTLTAGAVLGVTSIAFFLVWAASSDGEVATEAALRLRPSVALSRDQVWLGVEGALP